MTIDAEPFQSLMDGGSPSEYRALPSEVSSVLSICHSFIQTLKK